MQISSLELQVLVNDRPVREYGHQGRTYVAGHKGSRFTLKFRNNTAQRILAIPSIDGLSALDGQPATGASKGYIVSAYSSVEIKGWKKNLRETADFVFTDKTTTSYAAQTHGAQNCGVIAVKVFAEKYVPPAPVAAPNTIIIREHHHHPRDYRYPWWWDNHPPLWREWPSVMYTTTTMESSMGQASDAGSGKLMCSFNSAVGPTRSMGDATRSMGEATLNAAGQATYMANVTETPDFALGTGYGQVREDVISEATFDRGQELATFEIYYSDEASLIAAGVPLNKAAQISKPVPQSFGGWASPPGVTV